MKKLDRPVRLPFRLPLLLAAACLVPPAWSQTLYLGGTEVSRDANYQYLGAVGSLRHESLQNGPAWRLWLDRSRFHYRSGAVRHGGTVIGASGGLGYLFGDSKFSGSAFVSLAAHHTALTPNDPANASRGSHVTGQLQGDLFWRIAPSWNANLGLGYTVLNHGYWSRLRAGWNPQDRLTFGVEMTRQGDDSYTLHANGVYVSGLRAGALDITLKAGARRVLGDRTAPYAGIELGLTH